LGGGRSLVYRGLVLLTTSTNLYDELSYPTPSLGADKAPRVRDPVRRRLLGYTGLVGGRKLCGWSLVFVVNEY
jgi:hypothetical protein